LSHVSTFDGSAGNERYVAPPAIQPSVQPQQWFAAYTTPRHEKAVVRQLNVREVESFLPLYTSVRRWKNGCQVAVEQPLFPGYVFVHVERRHSVKVLQVPGVVSLVGSGREPSPLPHQEIESLRAALPERRYEPHPYLAVGDKVRIAEGPLAGMAGVLVRKKKSLRVVLTLDLIMQSVAVEIGMDEIEPLRK
jgi:transcription antitermination factor NusG